MKTKRTKIAELVLDYDLYPRPTIDSTHVGALLEALESGATFPPIVACAKTKRVVDGFHRHRMYQRGKVDSCDVEFRHYKTEAAIITEAIRLNAAHGRRLTPYDRARCLVLADKHGIDDLQIADAMNMTIERIAAIRATRFATDKFKVQVPLKRTIRHMAGQKLTPRQSDANRRLSGMNAAFYVNQVIELLESDLIDKDNDTLATRLEVLHGLLDTMFCTR